MIVITITKTSIIFTMGQERLGALHVLMHFIIKTIQQGFPGGTAVKNPPANAGDTGSSPDLGRSHMPWSN